MEIKILTLNLHKGFDQLGMKLVLDDLREAIRSTGADLVFLQEVVGLNEKHEDRFENWPVNGQYEFLADQVWTHYAYAKNAVYEKSHHGNALLSKFPIADSFQENLPAGRFEQRGLLYAKIALPQTGSIHCLCLHLSLFPKKRAEQFDHLVNFVEERIPAGEALIIAGDFNDWSREAREGLEKPLQLREVFRETYGQEAKTFPAALPLLALDRVYIKNLNIRGIEVLKNRPWHSLSDHAGLQVKLETE